MSGAVLPIVAEPVQPQGTRVEIGATEHGRRLREERLRAQHSSEEARVIRSDRPSRCSGWAPLALCRRLPVRWLGITRSNVELLLSLSLAS